MFPTRAVTLDCLHHLAPVGHSPAPLMTDLKVALSTVMDNDRSP